MKSEIIQVSVIMAVKNESKYISDALNSILSQSEINHEVIVVDDNSVDNTFDIVEDIASKNSKLQIHRNKGNGKVAAFNYGVELSKGNFICLFAGDDIMPPNSLKERFSALGNISVEKELAGLSKIRIISNDKSKNGMIVPKRKGKGSLSGQSPLMSRKTIELLFPVPDSLPNEDTWLEIAFNHTSLVRIIHSDTICCNWRLHDGNSMNMNMDYEVYKKKLVLRRGAYKLFLERYRGLLSIDEEKKLKEMVKGVQHYEMENIFGLMATKAHFIWKIRMLSTINPFFYKIRTTFYKLTTGW